MRAELQAADLRRRSCGPRDLLRHPFVWVSLLLGAACGSYQELPGFNQRVGPVLFQGGPFLGAALGLLIGGAAAVVVVELGGLRRMVSAVSLTVALAFALVGVAFLGPAEPVLGGPSPLPAQASGAAAAGLLGLVVGRVIQDLLRTTSVTSAARLIFATGAWTALAFVAARLLGGPDGELPLNRPGTATLALFATAPWGLAWLFLGGPHPDLPAKLTYWASLGFEGKPTSSPLAALFRPSNLPLARHPSADDQRRLAILALQEAGRRDAPPLPPEDSAAVQRGFHGVAAVWLLGTVILLLPFAAAKAL